MPIIAAEVIGVIEKCLEQDGCSVLYVLDNGIGLDERGMNALLGDGGKCEVVWIGRFLWERTYCGVPGFRFALYLIWGAFPEQENCFRACYFGFSNER